jgi:hypothetical protein
MSSRPAVPAGPVPAGGRTGTGRVVVEVVVDAPREAVWAALREPHQIRNWFGWDYELLDAEIAQIFADAAAENERAGTLRVDGGDWFELRGLGGGRTVIRLLRPPRRPGTRDAGYDEIDEGWLTFVQQLRFFLHLPGWAGSRRTVRLTGAVPPGGCGAADALGLSELAVVPVGATYRITVPAGDTLGGTVWYRTAHQVGLTVDGWGAGLLVLTDEPFAVRPGTSHREALLSTFGMPAAAVSDLRRRWSEQWRLLVPQS